VTSIAELKARAVPPPTVLRKFLASKWRLVKRFLPALQRPREKVPIPLTCVVVAANHYAGTVRGLTAIELTAIEFATSQGSGQVKAHGVQLRLSLL
jgi:hypothetical protein